MSVREADLAVHCARYQTADECLCDCPLHSSYMGYDYAMRLIFRADRPRMVKLILERRPALRKKVEIAKATLEAVKATIAGLQRELALGEDIWSLSTLLNMKLIEFRDAQAKYETITDAVVVEADKLLEQFYSVQLSRN